jgi:chromosome segregation ATPase
MYLKRLEVQGFKTFAKKTVLEFPAPKNGHNPLTVIVGPNGSGKSNLADAIRWCLGEQSMKHLRGKKTEDVIFSGSEGRSRSGFAEVTMVFDNEDQSMKIDFAEAAITRRLYRDGESDYLLNGQSTRLADIQLLLAEAGVGQRTYSVIGQGMIDHVLTSSPEERKVFFDDATGVRGLQIRRHQSMLKLEKSAVNLQEVQMLLDELEPRLNLLRRQVKRLEERETVEKELKEISKGYYETLWWNLSDEKAGIQSRVSAADEKVNLKKAELEAGDKKLAELEKGEVGKGEEGNAVSELQSAYKRAQAELADARRTHVMAEREIEIAKVRAQSSWSPLPLQDIIEEVKTLAFGHENLLKRLKTITSVEEIRELEKEVEEAASKSRKLRDRLIKPNPSDFAADPAQLQKIKQTEEAIAAAETKVKETEKAMDEKAKEANAAKSEVFAFQRSLRVIQTELMTLEQTRSAISVDIARVETRQESLGEEIRQTFDDIFLKSIKDVKPESRLTDMNGVHEEMLKLRRKLEMIGGIDEEVVKEHGEVETRFTFLSTQVGDLREAIKSTEKILDELDKQIHEQSEKAFKAINEEFKKYFKVLFGGGSCSLMKMTEDEMKEDEVNVTLDRAMEAVAAAHNKEEEEETPDAVRARVSARKDAVAGIDIQATPPGKKLKSLNLLSGGERALTSIALLCAIMETNPSPFVVLDEVDAALDESNTMRFANILNELRLHTQFIVVTHNRATMEKGDTLYGVTMGNDGVSTLLSVKIDEVATHGARR